MSSIRELHLAHTTWFVTKKLEFLILKDAKEHRIFNEADLQMRTAHHIHRGFVARDNGYVLFNQPSIAIGKGRGTRPAKPDILLCDGSGPLAAFELKCHLDAADQKLPAIKQGIEEDIDALWRLSQRYEVRYVFAIALLNMTDPTRFEELKRHFKARESWMKHLFRLHLIDFRSKSRGHDEWEAERQRTKELVFARPVGEAERPGWLDQIGFR